MFLQSFERVSGSVSLDRYVLLFRSSLKSSPKPQELLCCHHEGERDAGLTLKRREQDGKTEKLRQDNPGPPSHPVPALPTICSYAVIKPTSAGFLKEQLCGG